MQKNKYVNGILPMVLINFSIGSVYCWTLFKEYIWEYTGFSSSVTEWCFSLAIFCLGMSAAFGGPIVEKNPNRSAFLTFITFTTGWAVTGLGVQTRSAALTVIGFGVIQGIGLGLGYITPVKTMMIWLDNKKGFAAGLSIAAFGLAGVIANPIIDALLRELPVYTVFYVLAGIYGVCLLAATQLLHRPSYEDQLSSHGLDAAPFRAWEVILKPNFILLWLVFFINIAGGLAMISQEKQIYISDGIDKQSRIIVLFVSLSALSNLLGRLVMASLQDKLNMKHLPYYIMTAASALTTLVLALLPRNVALTLALIVVIQFCFGTGFSCMPNILHQNWGLKYLSTVHGLILSAWAIAGLVGNQFSSFMMNRFLDPLTGVRNLHPLYWSLAGAYALALVLTWVWARVAHPSGPPLPPDDADIDLVPVLT